MLRTTVCCNSVVDAVSNRITVASGLSFPTVVGSLVRDNEFITDHVSAALYCHYNTIAKCVYYLGEQKSRAGKFLSQKANFYRHILIDGCCITPLNVTRERRTKSSVVKVMIKGKLFAGEVLSVFHHHQPGVPDSVTPFIKM